MEDDFDPRELDDCEDHFVFQPARFKSALELPAGDDLLLVEAATAVHHEFRDSSKWKRLRCEKVDLFSERDRGTVVVLHVGTSVEFDWTWEGALAFRPQSLDGDAPVTNDDAETETFGNGLSWRGEILEFDEQNGCLFINVEASEKIPTTGEFFVRPFEFLGVLESVFNEDRFADIRQQLPGRLAAARGGVHPRIVPGSADSTVSLPELCTWWQHSWSILWGPPGTGKTYTTGQQIAAALADPTERILVVSTTNRATDAAAVSLGEAASNFATEALNSGQLLRLGKGAALPTFQTKGLEVMLQGNESELLQRISDLNLRLRQLADRDQIAFAKKQLQELRQQGNQNNMLFVDPDRRVIVATAFKALCFLKDPLVMTALADQKAPFTTIFIDEAGLISRATIAALSLLAARRVVLVGDSKQLAPISRISRVLPMRQQRWLASSGLSHLSKLIDSPAAVHVLREQRRMHPDVCDVVSKYQYGGGLTTAEQTRLRPSQAPLFLSDFSRTIWYVLDEEDDTELAEIRAERGPSNKSWIRSITARVLEKIFSNADLRQANGLFISPYKAQTESIAKWLSANGLDHWESSTVHSQQGSEAAVVIFDTVNASNSVWPFDEWKRLINVALSRSQEGFIVLASRSEMEEPYLRPLKQWLTPARLVPVGDHFQWQSVPIVGGRSPVDTGPSVAEDRGGYQTDIVQADRLMADSMGRQIASRKRMAPVPSREQQRLTNLTLDGKPRLVRGVAGSGKSYVLCNWMAKTVQRLQPHQDSPIWAVFANRSLHHLLRDSIEAAWSDLFVDTLFQPTPFPWESVCLLHIRDVLTGILPEVSLSMNHYEFDYDRAAAEYLNRRSIDQLLPRCGALFIDEAQDMGPSTLKLLLSMVEQTDADDPNSRPAHIFYDNAQNIYGRKTPKWSEFGLDLRGRSAILKESFRSTTPITELAVNVLNQLSSADPRHDFEELLELELLKSCQRQGQPWLEVQFSHLDGPAPIFHLCDRRENEIERIATHLWYLVDQEQISPPEITLLYVGDYVVNILETLLVPRLSGSGIELSIQKNRTFERRQNTILVTTPHSFKGYESEVVLIPCVDQFVSGDGQILAHALYVAMTRARSLLAIYGSTGTTPSSQKVTSALQQCIRLQSR